MLPSVSAETIILVSAPPLDMDSLHSDVLDWSCPEKLQMYLSSLNELLDARQLSRNASHRRMLQATAFPKAMVVAWCSSGAGPGTLLASAMG